MREHTYEETVENLNRLIGKVKRARKNKRPLNMSQFESQLIQDALYLLRDSIKSWRVLDDN